MKIKALAGMAAQCVLLGCSTLVFTTAYYIYGLFNQIFFRQKFQSA
ncbi:hypothetical protein FACS1894142_7990 [Spirochaetia bacterium]|nr:hypothetical protein FACS1894142_7990 [Spirochaetia bacterium]